MKITSRKTPIDLCRVPVPRVPYLAWYKGSRVLVDRAGLTHLSNGNRENGLLGATPLDALTEVTMVNEFEEVA